MKLLKTWSLIVRSCFLSKSIVYADNNGAIDVATSQIMNRTSKHISVKYYWFRQKIEKEFVIRKIESEN